MWRSACQCSAKGQRCAGRRCGCYMNGRGCGPSCACRKHGACRNPKPALDTSQSTSIVPASYSTSSSSSVLCPYGVTLSFQTDQGQPLPVITSASNEHYLVSDDGQSFQAVLVASPSPLPDGHAWRCDLHVDGSLVQSLLLNAGERIVVEGWRESDSRVRPMVFSKPPLVPDKDAANTSAGQIKLLVSRVIRSQLTTFEAKPIPDPAGAFSGDKFWKHGGLVAKAGAARDLAVKLYEWKTTLLPEFPEQYVVVSCSTAMNLILRNVLDRSNSAHSAFFPADEQDHDDAQDLIDLEESKEREEIRKRRRESKKWEVSCDLTTDSPTWTKKPRELPPPVDLEEELQRAERKEQQEQQESQGASSSSKSEMEPGASQNQPPRPEDSEESGEQPPALEAVKPEFV